MENKKNQELPKSGEDDIQAQITDKNEKDPTPVDSFKSGDKKEDRTYNKPFDEQMYGTFDEIRENRADADGKDGKPDVE